MEGFLETNLKAEHSIREFWNFLALLLIAVPLGTCDKAMPVHTGSHKHCEPLFVIQASGLAGSV